MTATTKLTSAEAVALSIELEAEIVRIVRLRKAIEFYLASTKDDLNKDLDLASGLIMDDIALKKKCADLCEKFNHGEYPMPPEFGYTELNKMVKSEYNRMRASIQKLALHQNDQDHKESLYNLYEAQFRLFLLKDRQEEAELGEEEYSPSPMW
jgi:hypothetical protein